MLDRSTCKQRRQNRRRGPESGGVGQAMLCDAMPCLACHADDMAMGMGMAISPGA